MRSKRFESRRWLALLDRYDVEFVVLNRQTDGDLVTSLHLDSRWTARQGAEEAIFFERRPPPGQQVPA
jgi:hypothetical protein